MKDLEVDEAGSTAYFSPKVYGMKELVRPNGQKVLEAEGSSYLRQRIVMSILSGRIISVRNIRNLDEEPGLKDHEVKFLRLMEQLTNGSSVFINKTGTRFELRPGALRGGTMEFDCGLERGMGYFIEYILLVAPFCKTAINITLTGLSWCHLDQSVDLIKYSTLPLLKRFLGTDEGLDLKIKRRGMPPEGGGLITLQCPIKTKLRPIQLVEPGKVKRIRGTAWACRVAPNTVNRIIESARSILNRFVSDVYIYSDHCSGEQAGKSPGFGISLLAETINEVKYTAEFASSPRGQTPVLPEDVGKEAATLLLSEVWKGGCIDSVHQTLTIGLMAVAPADVNKVLIGPMTNATAQFLRTIFDFLAVRFHIDDWHRAQRAIKSANRRKREEENKDSSSEDDEEGSEDDGDESSEDERLEQCRKYVLTCVGSGYTNIGKVAF